MSAAALSEFRQRLDSLEAAAEARTVNHAKLAEGMSEQEIINRIDFAFGKMERDAKAGKPLSSLEWRLIKGFVAAARDDEELRREWLLHWIALDEEAKCMATDGERNDQ